MSGDANAIHYAPTGCTTDQQIAHTASELLGRARKTGGFEYYFDAILTQGVGKGSTVFSTETGHHHMSGSNTNSSADSSPRTGTVVDHPSNIRFMLPPHKKWLPVKWADSGALEKVQYSKLTCSELKYEEQLRMAMQKCVDIHAQQNQTDVRAQPFASGWEDSDVQLHGSLLVVHCASETLATELRTVVCGKCKQTTRIHTVTENENRTLTRFLKPTRGQAQHGVQLYTTRRANIPNNRKQLTQRIKQEGAFRACTSDNLAKSNHQTTCNQLQPADLYQQPVIVPHWEAATTVADQPAGAYVRATAVHHNAKTHTVRVEHPEHQEGWSTPMQHVHPVLSCQETRRGNLVFCDTRELTGLSTPVHSAPKTSKMPKAPKAPKPNGGAAPKMQLCRVVQVHRPNNRLVCGYAHQQPVDIQLPAPFAVDVLNKRLHSSGLTTVTVKLLTTPAPHEPNAQTLVFHSTLPRFTVWGGASSCSELLGFGSGNSTHETGPAAASVSAIGALFANTKAKTNETKEATDGYVLVGPHPVSPQLHQAGGIRNETSVQLSAAHYHEKTATPHDHHHHNHSTIRLGKELLTWQVPLEACVPVRHVYTKDMDTYAHLSAYQNFPLRYLTPDRPQRGLLLFHEMGSGKSRTSIEMAQLDIEHAFWAHVDSSTKPQAHYPPHRTPSTHTAATHHQGTWFGTKPRVVLFSPTQEARDHFVDECAVWLASRWTCVDGTWMPMQHMYQSVEAGALQDEIQQHQREVIRFLTKHVLLPIVYTNNTNSLFDVIKVFRDGCANREFTPANQAVLRRFFHRTADDPSFQWSTRTMRPDDMYARLFSDTFVIIDEMHNMCNSIALATENQRPEHTSGCGTFFYRALLEAQNCRVVGLTGTPIQRTALAVAPLFNIIRGKYSLYNVTFSKSLARSDREMLFASFRPFAETVWADCNQTNHQNFIFTPWSSRSVTEALCSHIGHVRHQYKSSVHIECQDRELFPFAFQQYASLPATRPKKLYVYNNTSFLQSYVKNGELCNISQFIYRIVGLVSYISPPKQTAPNHTLAKASAKPELESEPTPTNKQNEYPVYSIHTVQLSAHQSHAAYLQSIVAKKKAINQTKADVEQRSGCNVNWKAVPQEVLDGKDGLLKLFFKGTTTDQQPAGQLQQHGIEQQYHQLLQKVHQLFATTASSSVMTTRTGAAIADCMQLNKRLAVFSPKMHRILSSLLSRADHKAVVYSDFIDGVGKFGSSSGQPHGEANSGHTGGGGGDGGGGGGGAGEAKKPPTKTAARAEEPPRHSSQKRRSVIMDEKHVGLSGLGLFGYVLQHNGYTRLRLRVHHPLETLHQKLWASKTNKRDVFMALGPQRCGNTDTLTLHELLAICADTQVELSAEEKRKLERDIRWNDLRTTVSDLCRRLFLQEEYNPNFMMHSVQHRVSFESVCRERIQAWWASPTVLPRPQFYAEYSDRCVANTASKVGRQCARQALLHLFNTRSLKQMLQLPLTDEMGDDVRKLLAKPVQPSPSPSSKEKHADEKHADAKLSLSKTKKGNTRHHKSHRHGRGGSQQRQSRSQRRNNRAKHSTRPNVRQSARTPKPRSSRVISHKCGVESGAPRAHGERARSSTKAPIATADTTGNAYGAVFQTLLVSMSVTEGVEFKDVRTMHILEPPTDYRKLEQMFGRVIRRGSHAGLRSCDRSVNIHLYLLSNNSSLDHVKQESFGQPYRKQLTADEHYWQSVIRRKYEISQEFYQIMKHVAVDCRSNLVLNTASYQDRALTCFEYPYQQNLQDWVDSDAPLYSPLDDISDMATTNTHINAVDLQKIARMTALNG